MQQTVRRFRIITLRPHWGQYIISQGFMCLVSLVLFLVAGHEKAEFYGDNTINGKSDFKADVTMKKATADNIEAKTSFKSKNISDGIAVPGAPSTAKLSAKLSEDDAPTSTEIKLGIVEEEGEGDGNGGGTE
jgi:hypothetical protein